MSVKRYLHLLGIHYRAAFLAQMEYRANFVASLVLSALWPFWVVSLVSVFFHHSDHLGGWSFNEALLVLGLYDIFIGFMETVLAPNVQQLHQHVEEGTLDFVLLKPANSQFLSTLTACNLFRLFDVAIGFGLIAVGLYRLDHVPDPAELAAFAVMLPAGMVTVYSIWVLLATLSFWFVRADNFAELFIGFYETGRFPVSIYNQWIRRVLTFVVPVAFLTTFPAAMLLGQASWVYVPGSVIVAGVLFVAAHRFWNYAVRFYSSASS
jgi:ABC-2 type transport system permease protein